jgi:hypothetical protein
MKKIIISLLFVATNYAVVAQSMAEHHNMFLTGLFNKYSNGSITFSIVLNEYELYRQDKNLPASNLTINDLKNNYLDGVTNVQTFVNKLKNQSLLTNSEANFITKLEIFLQNKYTGNGLPTENQLNGYLNDSKALMEYTALTATEKSKMESFFDSMRKSYTFWLSYENGVTSNARRCRWGCAICVAIFDAAGIAAGGVSGVGTGIAAGVAVSLFARCCICGNCGPQVQCSWN